MANQIPVPPVEMVMPQAANMAYNVVSYISLAVVALLLAREARRARSPVPLLCLLGAALSFLLEPAFDIVCLVWYPEVQHTPIFRAFNVSVPFWMLPAYAIYMGGQGYWMKKQFAAGITPGRLWSLVLLFWASNAVLEMPGLNLGIYTYYGPQPLRVFGFPLWMAMTNSLIPILVGAFLHSMRDVLTGARALLVVPMIPMIVAGGEAAAGWPVWLALNAGQAEAQGQALSSVAAIVTLGLSLSTVHLLGLTLCKPAQTAALRPRGSAVHAA